MKRCLLLGLFVTLSLAGCADSPMTITSMNTESIKQVPNDALCRTYQFSGFYAGDTYAVREEVKRRGIDCGTPGSARPSNAANSLMLMQLGTQMMRQSAPQPAGSIGGAPGGPTAFLKNNYVSGFNRICIYDRLGSQVALTITATSICPLTY